MVEVLIFLLGINWGIPNLSGMGPLILPRRRDLPPLRRRQTRTRLGRVHVLAVQDGRHGGAEVGFRGRGGRSRTRRRFAAERKDEKRFYILFYFRTISP